MPGSRCVEVHSGRPADKTVTTSRQSTSSLAVNAICKLHVDSYPALSQTDRCAALSVSLGDLLCCPGHVSDLSHAAEDDRCHPADKFD